MIVHFVGATRNIKNDFSWYQKVIGIVHKNGHVLSRNWMEAAYFEDAAGTLDKNDWTLLCRQIIGDLHRADMIIADGSDTSTFGAGYQIALALQQSKPTLLLRRKAMVDGAFTTGLVDEFLTRKNWNVRTLDKIVSQFLVENSEKLENTITLDDHIRYLSRLKVIASGKVSRSSK